jgi:alpha/beta hydrolase fold
MNNKYYHVSNQRMYSTTTTTLHRTVTVDGLSIFYREAGNQSNPKLVLLHGFPASSHQYRNLILALADHFHVVAPDYPGFGNSDMPNPDKFSYTFDRLSEIMEDFLKTIGFTHLDFTNISSSDIVPEKVIELVNELFNISKSESIQLDQVPGYNKEKLQVYGLSNSTAIFSILRDSIPQYCMV